MVNAAERAEEMRDLRGQIGELRGMDAEQEVIFRETSPRRRKVTVYSMTDGEAIEVPAYMADTVLNKRLEDGSFMFTAYKERAPEFREGNVKCFLHRDAPDRAVLLEIGLGGITCPAEHLANLHSKRMHAMHRHRDQWAAYQEAINEQRIEEDREERRKQLDATLAIAQAAAPKKGTG